MTSYVYGLGLISETDGAGVTTYLLTDGLGSTTQLVSSAGGVQESYQYDVFGGPRGTEPSPSVNDFRFTGQQDARVRRGPYYLRARAYRRRVWPGRCR